MSWNNSFSLFLPPFNCRFEELMKTLIADLCVAESIATQVPSWQIREYDQPAWNFRDILSNDISSFADGRFSTVDNFLIFLRSLQSIPGKIGRTVKFFLEMFRENFPIVPLSTAHLHNCVIFTEDI